MSHASAALTLAEAVDVAVEAARRQGADRFDLVTSESGRMGLDLFGGKVTKTALASTRGLSLRLFRGRRPGCAYTERLSLDAIRRTVTDALNLAGLADEVDLDLPGPVALPAVNLRLDNPALESLSLEQMRAFALRLEAAALEADPHVENVPYLSVSRGRRTAIVCNSNGVCYESCQRSCTAGVGAVAKDGDTRKMGIETRGGRAFDYDAELMARIAVERAVELLGASTLAPGRYPVVLSHRISPQLFSMFASPFFADAVHEGRSRLQGRLGQAVAASVLTIVSDPFIPSAPGSSLFDDEGVPTRTVGVVGEGVLQAYLCTLESAKKAGVSPTGTGSRDDSGGTAARFTNYVVRKGTHSLDDLLAVYPRCLYVVQLEGGAACSAVSGEISIGAQGFLYEGGRRIRPVDRVTLSTNFFDLLRGVRGLSDHYSVAFLPVTVPDVLVEDVHVSG